MNKEDGPKWNASCSEVGNEYVLDFFIELDQKVVKYRIEDIRFP